MAPETKSTVPQEGQILSEASRSKLYLYLTRVYVLGAFLYFAIEYFIHLGRTLGLNVVAEGVETEQQLAFLKENLCSEIQGFYFYKPMIAEDLVSILSIQGERSSWFR